MSLHPFRHDLRSAFRSLRRSPGFTLTAVFSTALGIGVATLVFGVQYALVLRPLPLPDPDRLVAVLMTGSDPSLVGRTVVADEAPCTVLGVMPPGFRFLVDQEAWVPLASRREVEPSRAVHNLFLIARLRPGVPLERAGEAVGRQVWIRRGAHRDRFTVLGVAADIRHLRLRQRARPGVYIPFRYGLRRRAGLMLRTHGDPRALIEEVKRSVHAVDPRVPVFYTATLDELRETSILPDRLSAELALLLGASAFLLALVGVYGVLSYTVRLRLREIGIRLALGASRASVMRRIIGRGLALGLAGIAIGLAGAVPLGRRLAPLLYGVLPTDPFSYALISIVVLDTVFIACWLPARRVLEVDPVDVLQED